MRALLVFAAMLAGLCSGACAKKESSADPAGSKGATPAASRNSDAGAGSGSAETPGAASGSATRSPAPRDELTRSLRALVTVRSFRGRMSSNMLGDAGSTANIEYEAPDRFRLVSDKAEVIWVGGAVYSRQQNGKWETRSSGGPNPIQSILNSDMVDQIGKQGEVTFIGADSVDGAPTLVYEFALANQPGGEGSGKSRVWVGTEDGLPRKVEAESVMQSRQLRSQFVYYDYNADVKIKPPR